MLGQFVQTLPGMLTPALLVAIFAVHLNLGCGREVPRSRHYHMFGFIVGVMAALVVAVLRNLVLLPRRSYVNLPALVLCVLSDIAMVVVLMRAQSIEQRWPHNTKRMNVANTVAGVGIAATTYYALQDMIVKLSSWVDTGQSAFTSDMLLRALGFALGIALACVVAAIIRSLNEQVIRRWFTVASIVAIAASLIHHVGALFSLLMSMRILILHGWPFRMMIFVNNHATQCILAQAALFMVAAVASIVVGVRAAALLHPDHNAAQARSMSAYRRRSIAVGCWTIVAVIFASLALTWGLYEVNKKPVLSEPEEYSLVDGVATITFDQVNDGHLHRFEYTAKDGTVMRFIIIQKNGGAYGIGLDACETCGDAGYYEKDGKIICMRCDVAINLATIGFKGGCNPIPFDYEIGDGQITIQTANLDALSSHFA